VTGWHIAEIHAFRDTSYESNRTSQVRQAHCHKHDSDAYRDATRLIQDLRALGDARSVARRPTQKTATSPHHLVDGFSAERVALAGKPSSV
jgi:hypothetical protein